MLVQQVRAVVALVGAGACQDTDQGTHPRRQLSGCLAVSGVDEGTAATERAAKAPPRSVPSSGSAFRSDVVVPKPAS
jgi:hypothetical protein